MTTVAVLQARMGSKRLPGKVMAELAGQPLLGHLLHRIKQVGPLDRIVVATTKGKEDDPIAELAYAHGVETARGSEDDLIERYILAAQGATHVVRLTADNPLLDPLVVEQVVLHYLGQEGEFDYVTNAGWGSGFSTGMVVEVFSMEALERAGREAQDPDEREHVGLYFRRHPELFRLGTFQYRLTVDTEEDLELVRHIFEALYPSNPNFCLEEIYALLRRRPEWVRINAHIKQV